MAWDTERTRQLLLTAAIDDFAARGLAGARVDAIARAAGVNKERIYQYFGDKQGLFEQALLHSLRDMLEATPIDGQGARSIGEWAGRLFDHLHAHPALARLLAWESLERDQPVAAGERLHSCTQKVEALQRVLPQLDAAAAGHLLLTTVTLTASWFSLGNLAGVMFRERPADAERRSALVIQVTAIAHGAAAE